MSSMRIMVFHLFTSFIHKALDSGAGTTGCIVLLATNDIWKSLIILLSIDTG